MKVDFTRFEGSLPYASEMYGIYQPLLGWKSRRIKRRFSKGIAKFRREALAYVSSKIYPDVKLDVRDQRFQGFERFGIGLPSLPQRSGVGGQVDSLVARTILRQIHEQGFDRNDPAIWKKLVGRDALDETMKEVGRQYTVNPALSLAAGNVAERPDPIAQLQSATEMESVVAGSLHQLYRFKMFDVLADIFYSPQVELDLADFFAMKAFIDPLESFDPKSDIDLVTLSPVGLVHLFRQFFFEFDTFLGTPVQHIWLSPGATVELIEIHSRKTIVERTLERALETILKKEEAVVQEDELSTAIRTENESNSKFGISASVDAGVNLGIFTAHANVSTNYGFDTNEKKAREQVHKQSRQQSSKLSSEIKENYKSTFKTITEVQDTTSKRYVLQNAGESLVNYELRRKMRQVGVQVQDMGTQLCWQTYVDNPGWMLGIAKLVHIAEPPDLANLKQPEAPPKLEAKTVEVVVPFQYENVSGSDEKDVTFYHGSDEESWPDHNDRIIWIREYKAEPPEHGYTLDEAIGLAPQHSSTCAAEARRINPDGRYEIRLNQVNFDEQSAINIKVTLRWTPPDQGTANAAYQTKLAEFDKEKERLFKEAYVKAARDRIKLASEIGSRPFHELREEERIVVYRRLIGMLLNVGINLDNPRTRHITSELINSLFDVDKMLYFVAPEWWRPRTHSREQTFGSLTSSGKSSATTPITSENIVSWGGVGEFRADNYFITENSAPAKLGASLGWLLQLDGDNLRNAFLNAPWVKAVIPIRPGREAAALNWLMHASVEGTDGLDAKYQAGSAAEAQLIATTLKSHSWTDPADQARYVATFGPGDVTIRDALRYLALVVEKKQEKSTEKQTEVLGGESKSYLPTDKVYEHGFYPLQGGFVAQSTKPFEVFDQWVEVLPTDQIVAVEVKYDPKTGMQV